MVASINELLDRFSKQGREKAEYLINNWDYVVPGTKEILMKSRINNKTLARICRYKNEYLHIKSWLLDREKINWLINNSRVEETKEGYAYNVFLSSISYENIDILINWILLSRKDAQYSIDESKDNIEKDLETIQAIEPTASIITESFSWKIISERTSIKTMDKSSFLHYGTVIPQEVRAFFDVGSLLKGQSKSIILNSQGQDYEARIEMDNIDSPRARLFWKNDFSKLIEQQLPGWHSLFEENDEFDLERPKIRFNKVEQEPDTYMVDFIDPNLIKLDIESEIAEEQVSYYEGGVKNYFGKRYERSSENRRMAIEIHGILCSICGFDYEKFYGEHGRGFIEIHHNKPLSSLDEEVVINPTTDLSPVCSNCHRMIHRKKDQVLSISELKGIIKRQ